MATKKSKIAADLATAAVEVSTPDYKKYLLDLAQPVADAECLLTIGNIDTFPKGELIALTAKAKQGKSQFIYYIIAAMLAGQPRGIVAPSQGSYKILLFDTEQSAASLQKGCKRIMRFAGLNETQNDNRFIPFFLRKVDYRERLKLIKEAICDLKPTFVIVDGIRDLIQDINNIMESVNLIQDLLTLATEHKCTILCVLHQNKGQDKNMRGHLGTELLNKVTDCFEVVKAKTTGQFKVTCTDSRNIPCPDLAFSINEESDFCAEDVPVKVDTSVDSDEKMKRIFRRCFSECQSMTYTELVDAYKQQADVGVSTAKSQIRKAKEKGFLLNDKKMYHLASD